MLALDNPFADYGHVVYGNRFIGRQDNLQIIESRVIRPPGGNLGIVGQRRVGKSSLVYQAIMIRKAELTTRRVIPIWISVGTYNDAYQFFCDLVKFSANQLDELGWNMRRTRELSNEVTQRGSENFDYASFKEFFEHTHQQQVRFIFILDEFDHATELFKGSITHFQRLRDLTYYGQATLVTTSRDPVLYIELKSSTHSTLAGTIIERHVGMFNEQEIAEWFEKVIFVGIHLAELDSIKIINYCGGHPYLLDKLAFEIVELYRQERQSYVDQAIAITESDFQREYESIIKHLEEKALLVPLIQAVSAASSGISPTILRELEGYGLIKFTTGERYTAFSKHFGDYLTHIKPMISELVVKSLTGAELQVLRLLTQGKQNKEIAKDLDRSTHTINSQIDSIFEKLGVNNRTAAADRARELRVIP